MMAFLALRNLNICSNAIIMCSVSLKKVCLCGKNPICYAMPLLLCCVRTSFAISICQMMIHYLLGMYSIYIAATYLPPWYDKIQSLQYSNFKEVVINVKKNVPPFWLAEKSLLEKDQKISKNWSVVENASNTMYTSYFE